MSASLAAWANLKLQRRVDVRLVQTDAPQGSALLHDPLTGQTLHLGTIETYLWQRLDGRATVSEILQSCQRMFAPRPVSPENLTRFLAQLQQFHLIRSTHHALSSRSGQQQRSAQSGFNPLAISWRGCNPDQFIRQLTPFVGWIFSPACMTLLCLLWLVTLVSLSHHTADLLLDLRLLPVRTPFVWGWLVLSIGLIKICHELGHAVAARRVGIPCRELGLMLLYGFPLMYCNVSEAVLLPRRRDRISISAAGIYVELWLALLAAWIWLSALPGTLQTIALQIMLICSLNTLLLNGNPLLRYDGYYVFSDLLGVHNLRSRSFAVLRRFLLRIVTGTEIAQPQPITTARTLGLLSYGVAATIYSWGLLLSLWLAGPTGRGSDPAELAGAGCEAESAGDAGSSRSRGRSLRAAATTLVAGRNWPGCHPADTRRLQLAAGAASDHRDTGNRPS